MTDFQIYMAMWKKIFIMWWPVIILMIMGLIALAADERRDRKKAFRDHESHKGN